MNEEFEKQLFECSFLIVSLLLKKYKENLISKEEFKLHTVHKIEFLQKNIESVTDSIQKQDVQNVISECLMIHR